MHGVHENKAGIQLPIVFVSEMSYGSPDETAEEGLSLKVRLLRKEKNMLWACSPLHDFIVSFV